MDGVISAARTLYGEQVDTFGAMVTNNSAASLYLMNVFLQRNVSFKTKLEQFLRNRINGVPCNTLVILANDEIKRVNKLMKHRANTLFVFVPIKCSAEEIAAMDIDRASSEFLGVVEQQFRNSLVRGKDPDSRILDGIKKMGDEKFATVDELIVRFNSKGETVLQMSGQVR